MKRIEICFGAHRSIVRGLTPLVQLRATEWAHQDMLLAEPEGRRSLFIKTGARLLQRSLASVAIEPLLVIVWP